MVSDLLSHRVLFLLLGKKCGKVRGEKGERGEELMVYLLKRMYVSRLDKASNRGEKGKEKLQRQGSKHFRQK